MTWLLPILNCVVGNDASKRQAAYRVLFNQAISETQINQVRDAPNKAWALGIGPFNKWMQSQLNLLFFIKKWLSTSWSGKAIMH